MAVFHMQINTVSRSSGRNAPASAAYRAGERIRDERTGALYDHRARADVLHKEILLPSRLEQAGTAPQWARDRAQLWNAAERIERRENSRVAREYMVALPAELSAAQRVQLARAFSRDIADRYNVAVDLAVHAPRPFGDPRNFHAHLLTTTRELRAEGLGPKSGLDMTGTTRAELGLPTNRREFTALRQRWADLVNEHLRAAHLEVRVDARSLAERGIDREPRPRLPWAAIAAERRGERSEVAERIRERYRARVAARAERVGSPPAVPQRAVEKSAVPPSEAQQRRRAAVREWLQYRQASGRELGAGASLTEALRREALEAWRAHRANERDVTAPERESSAQSAAEPQPDGPTPRAGHDPEVSW